MSALPLLQRRRKLNCRPWPYPTKRSKRLTASAEPRLEAFADAHESHVRPDAARVEEDAVVHPCDVGRLRRHLAARFEHEWHKLYMANVLPGPYSPDAESAARVHREAHGLVADEIYEVSEHT